METLRVLATLKAILPDLLDMVQRRSGVFAATVVDVQDPQGLRRIRIAMADKGGFVLSGWLLRCGFIGHDPPLPKQGETVLCAYLNGDPHEGVWFGVLTNEATEALFKRSPSIDSARAIAGDESDVVQGAREMVGESVVLRNQSGASVRCVGGDVILQDAFGNRRTLRELCGQNITVPVESAIPND